MSSRQVRQLSIPNPNPHPITDKGPTPVANRSSFAAFTILAEIPTIFSQCIAAVEPFLAHWTKRAVRTALPTARLPDCSDHTPLPIPVTRSNAWAPLCLVAASYYMLFLFIGFANAPASFRSPLSRDNFCAAYQEDLKHLFS